MARPRIPYSLLWLLHATTTSALFALDSVSFGHQAQLSPNGRALPGWSLSGDNHQVQLLSDRIILTPPYPGNARGAAWTDETVPSDDWTADFLFRASGQDMGTGNLNIWYTKDKDQIGTNSVYTVNSFDGLVLVIDQYGGTGGKIRGFLNDGTQNFKAHSSLESLAFGHCDYSYRNLGRPSNIRISNRNGLSVFVDDKECFRTDRVTLPSGYHFGLTAATADNPDSFEVSKFTVSSNSPSQPQHLNHPAARSGLPPTLEKLDRFPGSPEAVPDKPADEIKSQEDQFADLHNRLQGMTHQVANIFGEFDILQRKIEEKHEALMNALPSTAGGSAASGSDQQVQPRDNTAAINEIRRKMEGMERVLQHIQRDIEGKDYKEHINGLQMAVDGLKGGLTEHLPDTVARLIHASAPRMGMFVFVVLAFQVMLVGAYVVYKRRRDRMPKKYL
ncbi:hypothetical protein LTR91_015121 [Friedmanniomyces endolithicus]|uniref:L-type lectin-like domain-containing protein n=1 Tax=Friedmanniomyces endolithicus TaxID=329885 RepID=A0AAN6KAB5_9PEZI|nr:hypothetical protein LTR75_011949 [Friedmanniomyces endolithicus]KAK0830739.1 hypothetical protein LTR03_015734 [Friedmanniomyces endolithicus]KAK0885000.1 hypothetical protein LTR87_001398 [Friedmanniomyces endolithicus]KAK0887623.1 hypothetical protein LTR02_017054 [Friedmanniomyces endolithicus]KAK0923036.1 hypothetical protein LTR57_007066 [Friedmanniomyces endolithicus]